MEFLKFREEMTKHFNSMTKNINCKALYVTDVDADEMWKVYQDAILAKYNPVYRTNRVHECSSCRHFIKNIGGVVAIVDNKMVSIWDFATKTNEFKSVPEKMSKYVKSHKIVGLYQFNGYNVGHDHDSKRDEAGNIIQHSHFILKLPICAINVAGTIPEKNNDFVTGRNVFKRALDEITLDAVDTVLELINSNTLYRGAENRSALEEFRSKKIIYERFNNDKDRELYAWDCVTKLPPAFLRIRNSSIGTLLINISEGMELDSAVTQYESIVAPSNYKRPKAIYTQKMLDDAKKQISELGYMDSLPRRHATLNDISIHDVLFADRDVRKNTLGMTEGESFFSNMEKGTPVNPKKFSRAEEIGIDDFVTKVLPTVSKMEVLFENKLSKNMVTLIAPKIREAKPMFKWNNPFSWAYTGNMTDSVLKENVKNAGGDVTGVLRFSIQWNDSGDWDRNDLDAHCKICQRNVSKGLIYYADVYDYRTNGRLDVDIMYPTEGVPAVENITWPSVSTMKSKTYDFYVHCFNNRGGRSGFRAEVEFNGQIYAYDYTLPLKQDENVRVATVTVDENGNFSIQEHLNSNISSREVWGVSTNQFVPVSVVMNSPNYWEGEKGIGAKHTFFMLKDCADPESPNPFFNEFLNEDFKDYKRVMEALGGKAHVEVVPEQLSGIGFNHTQRGEATVKVHGSTERVFKVKF